MVDASPGRVRVGRRPSPFPRGRVELQARLAPGDGTDADIAIALKHLAAHLLVPGLTELQVDLSGLTRCGPEVLGVVLDLSEQMQERAGVLTVAVPVPDVVLEALDDASLADVFAFHRILRRSPAMRPTDHHDEPSA